MTQSSTITIVDKQRAGKKPTSTWKIVTDTGEELKAWAADGFKLDVGESYTGTIDKVVSTNPEYPGTDYFFIKFNKAKGNGEDTHAPIPLPGAKRENGQEHWDEVDIRRHTVTIACAMYASTGGHFGALLDEARTEWKAHIIRSKSPTVKLVTKKELVEDDWNELSAT